MRPTLGFVGSGQYGLEGIGGSVDVLEPLPASACGRVARGPLFRCVVNSSTSFGCRAPASPATPERQLHDRRGRRCTSALLSGAQRQSRASNAAARWGPREGAYDVSLPV